MAADIQENPAILSKLIGQSAKFAPDSSVAKIAKKILKKQADGKTISATEVKRFLRAYASEAKSMQETQQAVDAAQGWGNKGNAASGVETAVNDNPAEHTPKEQAVIEAYKQCTDERLKAFITRVRGLVSNDYRNKIRTTIATNTNRAAEKAAELTGVDTVCVRLSVLHTLSYFGKSSLFQPGYLSLRNADFLGDLHLRFAAKKSQAKDVLFALRKV